MKYSTHILIQIICRSQLGNTSAFCVQSYSEFPCKSRYQYVCQFFSVRMIQRLRLRKRSSRRTQLSSSSCTAEEEERYTGYAGRCKSTPYLYRGTAPITHTCILHSSHITYAKHPSHTRRAPTLRPRRPNVGRAFTNARWMCFAQ